MGEFKTTNMLNRINLSIFLLCCCIPVPASAVNSRSCVRDSLEFGKGSYVSPEQLVKGKVSGVRVSSTDGNIAGVLSTNVRGHNSGYLTSSPLWVVDGVPLSDCNYQIQDAFDKYYYGEYNYTPKMSQLDFLNLYDIESIEVLKNLSETSAYGSRGANGVIVINTKKGTTDNPTLTLNSNVGLALNNAFCHSHNLSFGFNRSRTAFRVSAFYRDIRDGFKGAGSDRFGGVRIGMDLKSNTIFHAGLEGNIAIGRQSLQSATANYGVPSMGLALRGIEIPGKVNSVEGWAADHDDYSNVFRSNGKIYLQVNFLPSLHWRTDAGFDVNSSGRYFWYDLNTEFGKQKTRAAAINTAILAGYNASTVLSYDRYIAGSHRISVDLKGSLFGEINKFDNMSGDHFLTAALREKGFSLRESASKPHYNNKSYFTWSASAGLAYSFGRFAGFNARFLADRMNLYDTAAQIYPSANAWIDVREILFGESNAVSALRIEGGWGKAGIRRYVPFQLAVVSVSQEKIDAALAAAGVELSPFEMEKNLYNFFDCYNKGLSSEWNVGLTTAFIGNRLSLHLGYYSKSTDEHFNIYGFGSKKFETSPLWRECPQWTLLEDSKSFGSRGFEADLSADIISTGACRWSLNLNVATAQSDLKYWLNEALPEFNPVPKVHGGLGTTVSCYGVSLDVNVAGACGFDVYNMNRMLSDKASAISSDYVERGDWLRLSDVTLGYDIPMQKVKWIKNLRVTLTGTNLLTATGYTGLNPDVNSFGADSNRLSGIDYGSLPLHRSLILGIKAEF